MHLTGSAQGNQVEAAPSTQRSQKRFTTGEYQIQSLTAATSEGHQPRPRTPVSPVEGWRRDAKTAASVIKTVLAIVTAKP